MVPGSFDAKTRKYFQKFNSVICTARFTNGELPIYQDWLGLSHGMQDTGFGFCQVGSNGDYNVYRQSGTNPCEAEPWIHEWLHTLESACEAFGGFVPSPDDAERYGYTKDPVADPINGFYQYYRDAMNAAVRDTAAGKDVGLTEGTWKSLAYIYDKKIRKK